jgi:hypothetical protein
MITKLRSLSVETDIAGESGNRVLIGLITAKDLNTLPQNITEFPRSFPNAKAPGGNSAN